MIRKVMKDFTFSDGTTIPAGNFLSVAMSCINTNSVKMYFHYPNFGSHVCTYRTITSTLKSSTAYALKRCEGTRVRHNLGTHSSPSIPIIYCSVSAVMRGTYIFSWSLAKADYHIYCSPGRFFAANEFKTILAHILLNYDVKIANGGGRPENMWFGRYCLPNTKAEVLFRKRV